MALVVCTLQGCLITTARKCSDRMNHNEFWAYKNHRMKPSCKITPVLAWHLQTWWCRKYINVYILGSSLMLSFYHRHDHHHLIASLTKEGSTQNWVSQLGVVTTAVIPNIFDWSFILCQSSYHKETLAQQHQPQPKLMHLIRQTKFIKKQ